MRIGTWNVNEGRPDERRGASGTWQDVAPSLDGLDVLALQEVPFDPDGRSPFLAAVQDGTRLRFAAAAVLSPAIFDPDGSSGLALLSRRPLAATQLVKLPNPDLVTTRDRPMRTYDKGILSGRVAIEDRTLTVASIHLFPFHRFGRKADEPEFGAIWETVAGFAEQHREDPLVICGDYNAESRDPLLRRVSRKLTSTFSAVRTSRAYKFDDILWSGELSLRTSSTTETFSDHKLCVADFTWAAGDAAR
jgi:endonuclease/exonuclease/phosphatase family metal-dependent hydrolase